MKQKENRKIEIENQPLHVSEWTDGRIDALGNLVLRFNGEHVSTKIRLRVEFYVLEEGKK